VALLAALISGRVAALRLSRMEDWEEGCSGFSMVSEGVSE
jgi:hypothetical protein